jgi:biotin carboxyl carrier protein
MKYRFEFQQQVYELEITPVESGYDVFYDGQKLAIKVQDEGGGRLKIQMGSGWVTLQTAVDRENHWVAYNGRTFALRKQNRARRRGQARDDHTEGMLRAPMPGQVREITAAEGDQVARGDTLMLLEAMKMEIRIQAPGPGTVVKIHAAVGQQVDKDQVLVEVH